MLCKSKHFLGVSRSVLSQAWSPRHDVSPENHGREKEGATASAYHHGSSCSNVIYIQKYDTFVILVLLLADLSTSFVILVLL